MNSFPGRQARETTAPMAGYLYRLELQVRDYELDLQGIVNNAVYQNYLEHTRHEFLKENGIDFAVFTGAMINLVVLRVEIDYRHPLRSGDRFWVGLNVAKESRLRFVFLQDIFRHPDDRPVLTARITGTSLNPQGRPAVSPELEKAFSRLLPEGT